RIGGGGRGDARGHGLHLEEVGGAGADSDLGGQTGDIRGCCVGTDAERCDRSPCRVGRRVDDHVVVRGRGGRRRRPGHIDGVAWGAGVVNGGHVAGGGRGVGGQGGRGAAGDVVVFLS